MGEINSFGICTQNTYEYIQSQRRISSHILENKLFHRKDYVAALGKI